MGEKGKLSVRKNKKGDKLIGELQYTKHSGKPSSMPIPQFKLNESLNGKECEFERDGGKITKIIVDGKELELKDKPSNKPARNFQRQSFKSTPRQNYDNNKEPEDCIGLEYLPKDTKNSIRIPLVDNFNLELNKMVKFEDGKFYFIKTNRGNITHKIKAKFSEIFIKNINNFYYDSINKLNLITKESILKPEWNMVIGLGGVSVHETSMTLHHIYGIPYVPGQALKGTVRSYIIQELFDSSEEKALNDKTFCDIFGSPESGYYKESKAGKVVFFDAFPIEVPKIDVDIMNPHYKEYYGDVGQLNPPADYYNPNPVNFLVVKDTKFKFVIGIRDKDNIKNGSEIFREHLLEITHKYLKEALNENGIGAKTAVGYGHLA